MPIFLQFELPPFRHQSLPSTPYKIYFHQGYIVCLNVIINVVEIKYNNNLSQQVKSTIS
jgi:hypothetical protein